MLIIIEGPNGAGKSTLAEALRRHLLDAAIGATPANTFLMHKGPPTDHPLREYEDPLLNYEPLQDNVICDRWHIGESVYPRIYGRDTQLDTATSRHLELFMRSRGAVYVVLLPSLGQLIHGHGQRNESFSTETLSREIDGFFREITKRPQRFITWREWSVSDDRLRHIHMEAYFRELEARKLAGFRTYVGGPHPRYLLLGEMRGVDGPGPDDKRPSFMPYRGTSGHYLLTHLDVPGTHGGLANACDVDDVAALWKALDSPNVVTLGTEAHKACEDAGIPHGAVPHPQWVRRFHHSKGHQYAQMIMRAVAYGEDMRRCTF